MTENQTPSDPNDPSTEPAGGWEPPADDWSAPSPDTDNASTDAFDSDQFGPDEFSTGETGTDHASTGESGTGEAGAEVPDDPIDPPPFAGPPPVRRLRRTSTSSGPGVAGGIARYLGVEAGLIKAAFIIVSFIGGLGIFAYVAAWALIPADTHPDQRPVVLNGGVAAIVIGTLALAAAASSVFNPGAVVGTLIGPAILIAIGFYVLDQRSVPQVITHRPYEEAGGHPNSPTAPGVRPRWIPPLTTTPIAAPPPPSPGQTQVWGAIHAEPAVVAPSAPRPPVTAVTLAAVAVVTGVLLAVDQFFDVDVTLTQYFGAGLGLIVAGLVVSLFIGRAIGLWFAGLIALIGLIVSPVAISFTVEGVGSETNTVVNADDLEPTYSLGVGELILDLRDLDLDANAATALDIEAGEIVVYLPEGEDITVEIDAEADFGEVTVVDEVFESSSTRIERGRSSVGGRLTERFEGREGAPVLTIEADARFGSIEVRP